MREEYYYRRDARKRLVQTHTTPRDQLQSKLDYE